MSRIPAIILGAAALALTLTGCAGAAASPVDVGHEAIIIDVRTAQEYAAGHLDGAENLDVTSGELSAALATLEQDAEYLVYCRSGNRSAQAVRLMQDAGFTDVTDLGSLDQAAQSTQLPVVG